MSMNAGESDKNTHAVGLMPGVLVLAAVYFVYLATHRLIARDEGFYVIASSLVLDGLHPYQDFFYPQMPLLPYLYALWMKFFGVSWESARICSALIATVTAGALFIVTRRLCGNFLALVAVILFCGAAQAFPWFVVVQTYGLSVMFLMLTVLLLTPASEECSEISFTHLVFAGILFALAVNTRLFFAGLFPILSIHIFFKLGVRPLLIFCSGASIGLVPLFIAYVSGAGDHYWFNNLWFHLSRSEQSFAEGLPKKMKILRVLAGFSASQKFDGFQSAMLIWSSVSFALLALIRRQYCGLPLLLGAGLGILSLLPTPSYVQYFSACIPFLIIPTMQLFSHIFQSSSVVVRKGAVVCAAVFFIVYLWSWPGDFLRYTRTGVGVIGVITEEAANFWNVENLKRAIPIINELTEEGEEVFVIWPGLLFGSHARPVHGLENHFGRLAASRLNLQDQERFSVLDKKGTNTVLREGKVRVAVIHRQALARGLKVSLEKGGFRAVKSVGGVYFYQRKEK